jgi:sugar lactone lactonase YvrE
MKSLAIRAVLALSLLACGDDGDSTPDGGGDGGADGPPAADAGEAVMLASFDPLSGQLPEGLTLQMGTPLVGFAPIGTVVRIDMGASINFGQIPTPSMTFTTGLATDMAGNVYAGVAAAGGTPAPMPGIYRFPANGGAATLFAMRTTAPEMFFANGLDIKDNVLYVSDSNGTVFSIPLATQTPAVWSDDPLLAGDLDACGGTGLGFALGANGIAHDADNFYVANTDLGRILRIPVESGGAAGAAEVIAESCDLHGADGIALDTDGSILVAQNGLGLISRVAQDGTVTVLDEGLDGPASVVLETTPQKRLLVTVSSFASSAADGGMPMPALVALPLP